MEHQPNNNLEQQPIIQNICKLIDAQQHMIDVLKLMNDMHNTEITDIQRKMKKLEERLNSPIVMAAPHPPRMKIVPKCVTPAAKLYTITEEEEGERDIKQ
jgi:hypothetical protein